MRSIITITILFCASLCYAQGVAGDPGTGDFYTASGGGGSFAYKGSCGNNVSGSGSSISCTSTLNIASGDHVYVGVGYQGTGSTNLISGVTCGSTTLTLVADNWEFGNYHFAAYRSTSGTANANSTCTASFSSSVTFTAIVAGNYTWGAGTATNITSKLPATGGQSLSPTGTVVWTPQVTSTVTTNIIVLGIEWNGTETVNSANGFTVRRSPPAGQTGFLLDQAAVAAGTIPAQGSAGAGDGQVCTFASTDQWLVTMLAEAQ